MTDYSELVRCLRDCFGEETETDFICDCAHCIMKDKIIDIKSEDGEAYSSDYTECVASLALAAADAIEALMRKLESRDQMLSHVVNGLDKSMIAIREIINGGDDRII
jgi:hypothetical protein